MRSSLQTMARVVGVVFLLVGVAGFIPGLTTHVGNMQFFGHDHMHPTQLLGLFDVSVFHNIVHLLFGFAGLVMAKTFMNAKRYFVGGGAIYLVLFIVGLFLEMASDTVNFVPLNTADNVLHLVLGLGMVGLGMVLGRRE